MRGRDVFNSVVYRCECTFMESLPLSEFISLIYDKQVTIIINNSQRTYPRTSYL
jgi:hypothetical protein